MWQEFGIALALLLIIEGIMPFLSPEQLRETLRKMIEMDNKTLRYIGLTSMLFGLALLYAVH
jgi:uncharacterized protein YjeT (DUF2065 family)